MTTPKEPTPTTDPPATDPPETDPPEVDPAEGETFTKADRDALKKALAAERKLHREVAAKLTQLEAAGASESEQQWMAKVTKATTDADAKIARVAARAALATAGLAGKPDRLVALLDLSEVTVDDDGAVTGLDEQIKTLKTDYPGLFGTKDGKPAVGQLNTGQRQPGKAPAKSAAQQIAEQLVGT